MKSLGILYVVATPIGNLNDISLRLKSILSKVDIIAAEDTRVTQKLLNYLGIQKKSTSYHQYNEIKKSRFLLAQLLEGLSVALVSDAGTPAISDPGYDLIRIAHEHNIKVIGIPGPSAIILGLSMSGLAINSFVFDAFFPKKIKDREEKIEELKNTNKAYVFYESVHRIKSTLLFLYEKLSHDQEIFIGRELTKKFEDYYRGLIGGLEEMLTTHKMPIKGEFILVIDKPKAKYEQSSQLESLFNFIDMNKMNNRSIKALSVLLNIPKNEIYKMYLKKADKIKLGAD